MCTAIPHVSSQGMVQWCPLLFLWERAPSTLLGGWWWVIDDDRSEGVSQVWITY
jgi:hypothetical protein